MLSIQSRCPGEQTDERWMVDATGTSEKEYNVG